MNILLLTSTIKPNPDQPQLVLVNPVDRLKDYESALEFYAHQLARGRLDKIIFVDNSGFDLGCLSDRFQSKNIEWISFYGLDYPNTYHRGYGEFKLIDYAFSHSITLRALCDSDVVWKVTGRYIIKNMGNVIKLAPARFDLYCDVKKNWVDMGLMAWNKAGYNSLIKDVWQKFATGMAPELILADAIKRQADASDTIIMTYFWPPFVVGRRGYDGSKYIGRFTPIRFALTLVIKSILWPFRYLSNLIIK